ncbi:hypothetical protein, unknown function [Leishmania tarentolae]|uniref:Uncharacterized protein n=1 Tax=Leishmania tarentolae TaxID=5689 RepID=A0A640KIX1_LEITA|nr:hypothetical protein, unknown function [Leishmania tarentolae]
MGQLASSSQANISTSGGAIASASHSEFCHAGRAEPPAMEVQNMLCTPELPPQTCGGDAGIDSFTKTVGTAGNGDDNASVIPILCLDASVLDIDQLFKSLELPPAQRAKALQEASMKARGVLLHVPANTSVGALKRFLLTETALAASEKTLNNGAVVLHLFALRRPLLSIADGAVTDATSSCAIFEAPSNSLLALAESMELSALKANDQLFFFPLIEVSESGGGSLAKDHVRAEADDPCGASLRREDAEEEDAAAASLSVNAGDPTTRSPALVLLYTHESSFGFDGDDVLLLGCCASICACIVTAICCMSRRKKKQKPNHANTQPNYYGGNGVPQYYNNGAGTTYYGQPQQQNYYSSGAPGYGMPPNAYSNSSANVLQPQPPHPNYYGGAYQYQPPYQQLNAIPLQPTYVSNAPVAGPL